MLHFLFLIKIDNYVACNVYVLLLYDMKVVYSYTCKTAFHKKKIHILL